MSGNLTAALESDRSKLLRWLERTEDTSGALLDPAPSTGTWFVDLQEYKDWINSDGPSMLWCTGARK